MPLDEYRRKRSFEKTPEPEGVVRSGGRSGLKFAVQKHDASHLHYDLRLEIDGVLKSWAVPKGPSLDPQVKRLAMPTEDHPMDYLDFEGEIPEGNYGAGEVIVWDTGTYAWTGAESVEQGTGLLKKGLEEGKLDIMLKGRKLKGRFALVKMKDGRSWLLIKKSDEHSTKKDITKDTSSAISKKVLSRDQKKPDPPRSVSPMLATPTEHPFSEEGWIFEPKFDGYRAIGHSIKRKVELYSRNKKDFKEKYKAIADALAKFEQDAVFDGEIVSLDKAGRENFQALQNYSKEGGTLKYMVFDLLFLNGIDMRHLPLINRKSILKEALQGSPKELEYVEHAEKDGNGFFKKMEKDGFEGAIAKKANSRYAEGARSRNWLKIKSKKRQEAVIGGFTSPRGSRKRFGALILGVYEKEELKYIGHTGTGFSEASLRDVYSKLSKLEQKTSPFKEKVTVNAPATWVRPELVCEVEFREWTSGGQMRQPVFAGLREDKDPRDVAKDNPENAENTPLEIEVTNPDKVLWPEEGYTKMDLINYYNDISSYILPYLKDRPQVLHRHPDGIKETGFYQKDFTYDAPDFVETIDIYSKSKGEDIRYLLCQNKETLLYMANLGTIELNPWLSKADDLNKPDIMVIDLDPGEMAFSEVIQTAQATREVLELACQKSYCKTSGKTGIHICVPLGRKYSYGQIREFAKLIAMAVNQRLPDITSIERNPKSRGGKLYLDYMQNTYGQTITAPYSVRPQPGVTVSTPLEWGEVKEGLDPSGFTIKNTLGRIQEKGDLWRPILEESIDLLDAIQCLQSDTAGS